MALHEQCVGATDEWYTPLYIFEALGVNFDVDVASPGHHVVPWVPATAHITGDSLNRKWDGFIWMNPPFGGRNGLIPWLDKFASHANGVCLVPDRTSAPWWQEFVRKIELTLFVDSKIKFINWKGEQGRSPAQGTCLWSIGQRGAEALRRAERTGLGYLSKAAGNN